MWIEMEGDETDKRKRFNQEITLSLNRTVFVVTTIQKLNHVMKRFGRKEEDTPRQKVENCGMACRGRASENRFL